MISKIVKCLSLGEKMYVYITSFSSGTENNYGKGLYIEELGHQSPG